MLTENGTTCTCGNMSVTGSVAHKQSAFQGKFHNTDTVPVHQIHRGAIDLSDVAQIEVRPLGTHQINITCQSCGCRLIIYASKKGAFCQLKQPVLTAVYGSCPSDSFMVSAASGCHIPKSMQRLFQGDQIQGLITQNASNLTDDYNLVLPHKTMGGEQEGEDYDVMFGNTDEPIVGSYSEVGLFTKESDYLIYQD